MLVAWKPKSRKGSLEIKSLKITKVNVNLIYERYVLFHTIHVCVVPIAQKSKVINKDLLLIGYSLNNKFY